MINIQAKDKAKKIEVGEVIPNIEIQQNPAFYKLSVKNSFKEGQDLIIKVIPEDYDSDPDIYISKEEEYPNSALTSDWQCSSFGKDTCTIHHKNISSSDIFNIGIVCFQKTCKFKLLTMLTEEYQLQNGVEQQIQMEKDEAKIFKFKVPPMSGQNQSVTIKASAYKANIHDFNLLVHVPSQRLTEQGDVLPATNYESRRGISAWKNGQVIKLTEKDSMYWCTDCELKILLDIIDDGQYHIIAYTNEDQPILQNNQQIDDIVNFNDIQCYKYYIQEEDTRFQVNINTYSGKVDININPSTIPQNWEDFKFKREQAHDSIIDLSPGLRDHIANQKKGLYFICIKGDLTSTYSIKVREYQQERGGKTELEDGFSEVFFVRRQHVNVHIYHVPKLEYTDEDIKVQVNVQTIRGEKPILIGKLCEESNFEKCGNNLSRDDFFSRQDQFFYGSDNGQQIQLTIDHDEIYCQENFNGDCYYIFGLTNSETTQSSLYEITVTHQQNNHILLKEGRQQLDNVDQQTFKFYKFSLLDDKNVESINFEITPYHGDSDLYVSRQVQFPNRTNNEKSSIRLGNTPDHVKFTKENNQDTLVGTYYIGVYGYTYATYSILASVGRKGQGNIDNIEVDVYTQILQGVSLKKTLHNELELFVGYFQVDIQDQDEEPAIFINIQNTQGKTNCFIRYNQIGNPFQYDYHIVDGSINIEPGNQNYHKKGTYYITCIPKFGFFDLFTDDYYTFIITWRLESTQAILVQHGNMNIHTKPHKYSYFTHYVLEAGSDISITLQNQGQQEIYVSLNPENKKPTRDNYDYSTIDVMGQHFQNGKSLFLSNHLLKNVNPACEDLGYTSESPCVIYIGVHCDQSNDCQGTIDLQYESNKPQRLIGGQSYHAILQPKSYKYYYIPISKSSIEDDLFAVLTPLKGEIDLYATYQKTVNNDRQWNLPSTTQYDYKSKNKLRTEMIHLDKKEFEKCFLQSQNQNEDCIIVFAIYAPENQEQTVFNFIAYRNLIEINKDNSMTGFVKEGEFTYFLYYEQCSNCTMIVSLSSYYSGDPDLYISKGDKIPTLFDYDIKKATVHPEVLVLNTNHEFFKNNEITSLEGYYVIGVYGNKNTTFSLSITSQETPVIVLVDNLPITHQQEQFEVAYYQFYNWEEKDIEIQVEIESGEVDLFVNTFDPNNTSDNFVDQLPHSKKQNLPWFVEDINQKNYNTGKEILIMSDDRNYCSDCIYLIGVLSKEKKSKYSITARNINAELSYANLLKIGEVKMINLMEKGEQRIYQFLLESNQPASIVPTIISGQVKMYLGFEELISKAFHSQTDNKVYKIEDPYLKTEVNYYLTIEALTEYVEMTVAINQKLVIIKLRDGVPQVLNFEDEMDVNKYMLFELPAGINTVLFNVKSKTQDFFPKLYIYQYQEKDKIIFPPKQTTKYQISTDWDKNLYLMRYSAKFNNKNDQGGLAINLQNRYKNTLIQNQRKEDSAQAIITVSHSQVIKLLPQEEFFGKLEQGNSVLQIFEVDIGGQKNLLIEFSQCLGFSSFRVQDSEKKSIQLQREMKQGKEIAYAMDVTGPLYIFVEPQAIFAQASAFSAEYMIKASFVSNIEIALASNYFPGNGGQINIELIKSEDKMIKLSWEPLYKITSMQSPQEIKNIRYELISSEDKKARLDSVCASKRNSEYINSVNDIKITEYSLKDIKPGVKLYFNVIAVIDEEQIAIPYEMVTLYIPEQSTMSKTLIGLIIGLLILFVALAIYFYKKSKNLKQMIEYEMTEVQNQDNQVMKYKRVGGLADQKNTKQNYGNLAEETQEDNSNV